MKCFTCSSDPTDADFKKGCADPFDLTDVQIITAPDSKFDDTSTACIVINYYYNSIKNNQFYNLHVNKYNIYIIRKKQLNEMESVLREEESHRLALATL